MLAGFARLVPHGLTCFSWVSCNSVVAYYLSAAGAIGHLAHCHAPASQVKEALSSFPSGHASTAFAGLGFMAWFFYGLYRPHPSAVGGAVSEDYESLSSPRVNGFPVPPVQLLWAVLSFASVLICVYVAVSRTRDYW